MATKKTKRKIDVTISIIFSILSFSALIWYLFNLVNTNRYEAYFIAENIEGFNPLYLLSFAPILISIIFAIYEKLVRGLFSVLFFLLITVINAGVDDANASIFIFIVYFIACFLLCLNMIISGSDNRYYEPKLTIPPSYTPVDDYAANSFSKYTFLDDDPLYTSSSSTPSYSPTYSSSSGSSSLYSPPSESFGSGPLTFEQKCDYTNSLCGGLYTYGGMETIENDPYLTPEQKEDMKRHYMIFGD